MTNDLGHASVTQYGCAELLGGKCICDYEPGIIGAGVVVDGATRQLFAFEARLTLECLRSVQVRVLERAPSRHELVQEKPSAKLQFSHSRATIDGPRKGKRLYQMRGDAQQRLTLADRLVNEVQLPMLQISDSAVNQARRSP